jgi:hypothetical protein
MSGMRWLIVTGILFLAGCDFFGGGKHEPRGTKIPASLTWMSTTLSPSGPIETGLPPMASEPVYSDTPDTYLSYRITPSNMEGRLIQAMLMVGEPGSGKGCSALFISGMGDDGYLGKDIGDSRDLPLFNLANRLTLDSDFRCCGETYPDDSYAYSGWFEIMFAYVDVTFSVAAGNLEGPHTVRTSFCDVGDLGTRKGDLQYKTPEGFRWVDSATGELRSSRPSKPLRLHWVFDYDGSGDGRGNQHIPTLSVAVQDTQKVHMPADTVLANAWEFVVDFILRRGLIFRRVNPDTMSTPAQLLSVFDINAGRDNASSSAEGISSNFYAIRTPLGQTRPNDFKDSLGTWIQAPPDTADPGS